ncbi:hypothetical protein B0H14DRAFT_2595106 [Mycena olivaceomarginata]|nr:hypothetical protein B0H14DRAFT_2595106 [Mycena olivaceomarginata]
MDSMGKLAWGGRMEKMIRNTDTAWMFGTEWAMLLILVAIGNMWWLSERRKQREMSIIEQNTQQGCKVQKTGGNPMWDDAILLGITKSPARATPKTPSGPKVNSETGREPLMVDGIRLVTAGDHSCGHITEHNLLSSFLSFLSMSTNMLEHRLPKSNLVGETQATCCDQGTKKAGLLCGPKSTMPLTKKYTRHMVCYSNHRWLFCDDELNHNDLIQQTTVPPFSRSSNTQMKQGGP